jgi:hypothetical protein
MPLDAEFEKIILSFTKWIAQQYLMFHLCSFK